MALQWLRDQMKYLKWVLWIVIAAFVVLFGNDWSGVNAPLQAGDVAATVGDETVTMAEFRQQYQAIESQYRQIFGDQYNDDMMRRFNLPQQALNNAIRRRILLMEARDMGLDIADQELRRAILDIPGLTDDSGRFIGSDAYSRLLQSNRYTPESFEEAMRDDLLIAKLNSVLADTVYVSDAAVERAYRAQSETATIRFVQLPGSEFPGVEVPADALQAYYADNQGDYQLPERRVVSYILVDAVQMRRDIEVTDDEIKAYYDANPDSYRREAQATARHILLTLGPNRDEDAARAELEALKARIEGGEDFAALAREASDDPDTRDRGGDLGSFGRDGFVADFTNPIFAADPGSLIGPFKTQYGVHVVEVQSVLEAGMRPLAEVTAQIRAVLLNERTQQLSEDKAKELSQRIGAEGVTTVDGLRGLAEEASVGFQTTTPFGEGDVVPGIGRGQFNEIAFGLNPEGISEPVKVPRGWAILRLDAIESPRPQTFEEVEARIRPIVLREQQKVAAEARLAEIKASLEAGSTTLEETAETLGLELQDAPAFNVDGSIPGIGADRAIVDAALAADAGTFGGPFPTPVGAMLFEVTERALFDPTAFTEAQTTVRTEEEQTQLRNLMASIVELRMRDLDVQRAPGIFAAFGIEDPASPVG